MDIINIKSPKSNQIFNDYVIVAGSLNSTKVHWLFYVAGSLYDCLLCTFYYNILAIKYGLLLGKIKNSAASRVFLGREKC